MSAALRAGRVVVAAAVLLGCKATAEETKSVAAPGAETLTPAQERAAKNTERVITPAEVPLPEDFDGEAVREVTPSNARATLDAIRAEVAADEAAPLPAAEAP